MNDLLFVSPPPLAIVPWLIIKMKIIFIFFAATDFHVKPMDWSKTGEEVFVTSSDGIDADDCPTKSSVMALAVTCALLVNIQ
jgi:hypothetical protein